MARCEDFEERIDFKGKSYIRCNGTAIRFAEKSYRDYYYTVYCDRCSFACVKKMRRGDFNNEHDGQN